MYIDIHTHQTNSGSGISLHQWNAPADALQAEALPEMSPFSTCSVGLHPQAIHPIDWKAQLHWVFKALDFPAVKAVGECGLDRLVATPRDIQEEVFIQQLKWAMEVKKPVIIHCVKAFDELIAIQKVWRPKIPLLVHGFHKNSQVAEALFTRGFFISLDDRIPTSLTAQFLEQYQDQILLETDMRPCQIDTVYKQFADRIGWTLEKVKQKIEENYWLFTHPL